MTQLESLRKHFESHATITPLQAFNIYGILRSSERIRELEREGWIFDHALVAVPSRSGKPAHVCQYTLVSKPKHLQEVAA